MNASTQPAGLNSAFVSQCQAKVHAELQRLVGPGPAGFWHDACAMANNAQNLTSRSHLISHLLREIESALRSTAMGTFRDLSELVEMRKEQTKTKPGNHEHQVREISAALNLQGTTYEETWLRLCKGQIPYKLSGSAHRDALFQPRALDADFRQMFIAVEDLFGAILNAIATKFLYVTAQIDELCAIAEPTRAHATVLKQHIPHTPVTIGYLFRKLESHLWLPILDNQGYFNHLSEAGPETQRLFYSAAAYLTKVAPKAPEKALEVALKVESNNVWIREEMLRAALAMPSQLAAKLATKQADWISTKTETDGFLEEPAAELVVLLAKSGQMDAALALAESLFHLAPKTRDLPDDLDDEIRELYSDPEPKGLFEPIRYSKTIERVLSPLTKVDAWQSAALWSKLLDAAIGMEVNDIKDRPENCDYSWCWRSAIEDSDQNWQSSYKGLLAVALRDTIEAILKEDQGQFANVVEFLERREPCWDIYRRMVLHFLRLHPKGHGHMIAEKLCDHNNFKNPDLRHEYVMLSKAQFGNLSESQKAVVLGWIEKDFDRQGEKDFVKKEHGIDMTEEQLDERVERWQLDKLHPINNWLPDEWKARYDELVAKYEEPEHPEFISYSEGVTYGSPSPKTVDELGAMPVEEMIDFLVSWKDDPQLDPLDRKPTSRGLGSNLIGVISATPSKLLDNCAAFKKLPPKFLCYALEGLSAAKRDKRVDSWDWEPLLDLLLNLVTQYPPNRDTSLDGLEWSLRSAASLMETGVSAGTAEFPFEKRDLVWQVLHRLTIASDPTPEHEEKYGGDNMGPATLALNTTRGKAMIALVRYGLWLRRQYEKQEDGKATIAEGLCAMPEVKECLDWHLDPQNDPSPAIRSIYGRWYPWLHLLDPGWAQENVAKIFPEAIAEKSLYDAAWRTYVCFCRPYDDVFGVLEPEYARAVQSLGVDTDSEMGGASYNQSLAEHLMAYHGRGLVHHDQQNGLLNTFFFKATPKLRCHAIDCIGRGLRETPQTPPPEIIERAKGLWDKRLTFHAQTGVQAETEELQGFGSWFFSERFEEAWCMRQLVRVLELAKDIRMDYFVMQRLVEICDKYETETLQILAPFIEGKEPYRVTGFGKSIKAILAKLVKSQTEPVRNKAIALVNKMASLGFMDYGQLLE